jgi:hypothetical protein
LQLGQQSLNPDFLPSSWVQTALSHGAQNSGMPFLFAIMIGGLDETLLHLTI